MATIADKKKESQKRAIDAWNAREKALQARNPDYTPRIRTYSEPKPLAPKREYTGRPVFNPRGPVSVTATAVRQSNKDYLAATRTGSAKRRKSTGASRKARAGK